MAKLSDEELLQQLNGNKTPRLSDEALLAVLNAKGPDQQQSMPWSDVGSGFIKNLLPSIGNAVIGTGQALWNMPETTQSLYQGITHPSQSLPAIGQSYIDKYGSLEGFKQTLANNPASILSDVALAIPNGTKLSPTLNIQDKAKGLLQSGVELTPGQMSGGLLKNIEDKLTTLPLTGYKINQRRGEALSGFNTNEVNKALESINKTTTASGTSAINEAHNHISNAYDAALNGATISLNNPQIKAIGQTGAKANLPPQYYNKYDTELTNILHPLRQGPIDGTTYKVKVISNINDRIRKYSNSTDPLDDYVAEHLAKVKDNLNTTLAKPGVLSGADPTSMLDQLKKADAAHAKMVPIDKAATAPGSQGGIFSANTLLSKYKEPSNLRARATGTNFNQQFLSDANDILPSKVPSSGTTERLLMTGGLGYLSPKFVGADVLGYLLGSKPVQNNIVKPMLFKGVHMTPALKALLATQPLTRGNK